jgi:hypothetical protein
MANCLPKGVLEEFCDICEGILTFADKEEGIASAYLGVVWGLWCIVERLLIAECPN